MLVNPQQVLGLVDGRWCWLPPALRTALARDGPALVSAADRASRPRRFTPVAVVQRNPMRIYRRLFSTSAGRNRLL